MFLRAISFAVFCWIGSIHLWGQAANQAIGEVTAVNAASAQISMKTDKGEAVTVVTAPNTAFRKVPAGAQNLSTAVRVELSAIGVGDRIVAAGQWSDDRSKIEARTVIVMSRSELDEKRRGEQEDWRKRGIAGTVASVDAAGKAFTMSVGARKVVVQTGAAQFLRYAPDSIRFSDARPSSLADVREGDQVRALGDKSADGSSYVAERVVSGTFRQLAATVNSVNAAAGEIVVKDLATKKNLTVRVSADSVLRRLPAQTASTLAGRYKGGGGGASEDIGQTLAHLPAMPLADLKAGDAIMLSSTSGSDAGRVTAVMLLAGVEPLLTASPNAMRDIMGGWNLGDAGQ